MILLIINQLSQMVFAFNALFLIVLLFVKFIY
jgi:hypothetical protein